MTVKTSKKIYAYFSNAKNLIVKVNEMSKYFRLEKLTKINLSYDDIITVDIDESELDDDLLKNENIFCLMVIYVMGTGQ